jgi:hypothetical protein
MSIRTKVYIYIYIGISVGNLNGKKGVIVDSGTTDICIYVYTYIYIYIYTCKYIHV